MLARTTFCFPDSVLEPDDSAASGGFDLVPLADEFGRLECTDHIEMTEGGQIDDYIEAHVHGVIDLCSDVEALVVDPSFRRTEKEERTEKEDRTENEDQARGAGVHVEWHEGRRLPVSELDQHPDFRGPHIVAVGDRVAERGCWTRRCLGRAATPGAEDPEELKRLWHYVARFGAPHSRV